MKIKKIIQEEQIKEQENGRIMIEKIKKGFEEKRRKETKEDHDTTEDHRRKIMKLKNDHQEYIKNLDKSQLKRIKETEKDLAAEQKSLEEERKEIEATKKSMHEPEQKKYLESDQEVISLEEQIEKNEFNMKMVQKENDELKKKIDKLEGEKQSGPSISIHPVDHIKQRDNVAHIFFFFGYELS